MWVAECMHEISCGCGRLDTKWITVGHPPSFLGGQPTTSKNICKFFESIYPQILSMFPLKSQESGWEFIHDFLILHFPTPFLWTLLFNLSEGFEFYFTWFVNLYFYLQIYIIIIYKSLGQDFASHSLQCVFASLHLYEVFKQLDFRITLSFCPSSLLLRSQAIFFIDITWFPISQKFTSNKKRNKRWNDDNSNGFCKI